MIAHYQAVPTTLMTTIASKHSESGESFTVALENIHLPTLLGMQSISISFTTCGSLTVPPLSCRSFYLSPKS